jgi:formate-dependent nitrite reductase membrane component NrfD
MRNIGTQKSWGWIISIYIFCAGLGGGVFLISYILRMLNLFENIARVSSLLGPLLVLFGTFFLLADLGSASNSYRLFITPRTLKTSWIARGAWILSAFILFGLAYALPSFSLFQWLPWSSLTAVGQGVGAVAGLLAVVVTLYPGLLFGVLRSVPFWNNSALPLLFFMSGLDTGLGLIILLSLSGEAKAENLRLLEKVDILLLPLILLTLGVYLYNARQSGPAAEYSLRSLQSILFVGGVLLIGILLPLTLAIWLSLIADSSINSTLAALAAGATLIGGLCLRYSIVRSGVNRSEVEV